jgi:hypothetical protein
MSNVLQKYDQAALGGLAEIELALRSGSAAAE